MPFTDDAIALNTIISKSHCRMPVRYHTETDLVVEMSTLTHDAWSRRRNGSRFHEPILKTSLRVEIVVDFFYNIVVRPNLKRIWEFVEPLEWK